MSTPAIPASKPPTVVAASRTKPIPNMLVVAESGYGKTRSLKNLPWASGTCAYIDTEQKGFDWIGTIPDAHYYTPNLNPKECLDIIRKVKANPGYKYVCVDSFSGFSNNAIEWCKTAYTGYDIYSQYTSLVDQFLKLVSSTTQRMIVTAIPECLMADSEGNTTGTMIKRTKVYGRQSEGRVEPTFAYSLHIKVTPVPGQRPLHRFVLVSDGKSQSKVPETVLDELKAVEVENDVWALLQKVEKFGQ